MYFKIIIFILLPLFLYSNEKLENINIGYHNNISVVSNYKNSRSALNIWVKDFALNIYENINIELYRDKETVINDYINNKLDIIPITPYGYLKYKEKLDNNTMDYWHLKKSKKNAYQKMYLITNIKSNINSISDLKDKKIGIDTLNNFGKVFLEKTYIDSTKKSADNLISKISYNKSNSLVLQTYFSKYDAAVVTSFEYDIMLELNPAIKKKIKILKSSPEIFPYLLIFFNKNNTSENIKIFKEILNKFFASERKHELFDMLKIKDLSIIEKRDLDKLDEYYKEYLKSKSKYK